MKQFYVSSILTLFLLVNFAFSQETGQKIPFVATHHLSIGHSTTKTTSCGVDTIAYPYIKELAFTAPADSFFVDAMVGSVRSASQAYHINDPLLIHGIQFWGGAYSTSTAPQTLQVRAYLYSVDANNMPVTKLDSADVTITNTYDFYEAIFANPYAYDQNFAVAVRSIPNDTLAVMTNNAGNTWSSTNYGESLAWRRFGSGIWNSSASFFGQDLEYMIFPIVSYDITADFTLAGPSCTDEVSEFNSTSSSHLGNPMLNLNTFNAYWNIAVEDSTLTWSNGGVDQIGEDALYTFVTGGLQTIELTAEMQGYYTLCSDTRSEDIMVVETPLAQTNPSVPVTMCDGEIIEISALPAAGVTYQWLKDDTEITDSINGNYITGIAGSYAVITTNICGVDTSAVLNVVVNPLPQIPVITSSGTYLIASPSGGLHQWYLDGAEIQGETNDSLTIMQNGNYTVVVTNAFDCSSESEIFEVDYVSLMENTLDLISIFPNPSTGKFTITAKNGGSIEITSCEGKIILSAVIKGVQGIPMDLSGYGNGVYFVRYSGEEGEKILRVVVE